MIGDIIDEVLEVLNDTGYSDDVYPGSMGPDVKHPTGAHAFDQSGLDEIGMVTLSSWPLLIGFIMV